MVQTISLLTPRSRQFISSPTHVVSPIIRRVSSPMTSLQSVPHAHDNAVDSFKKGTNTAWFKETWSKQFNSLEYGRLL